MKQFAGFALIAATTLAATLAVGAPPALAEGAGGHGARMMQRLDLNRDGAITEAEMLAAAQARIARRIAKRFAMMDRNGDGRIERSEFDEHGTARFAALDTDGDDRVSRDEIAARRHERRHGWHDDLLPDG